MMTALVVFLAQSLVASAPLVLAAMGGVLSERSGVPTIALEGYVLVGAFAAAVAGVATGSVALAVVAAVLAGAALGAVFALGAVTLRANAIVVGVAVNLLAAAGTRVALKVVYGSASNSPPLRNAASRSGSLASVALRDALTQPVVWLAPLVVLAVVVLFDRTPFGLRLGAAGEHPEACRAQGIRVERVRWSALCLGGAVAAVGGAHLTLNQHEFVAYMSGGRGFLALAAVILGAWRPVRACIAAVAIGALTALEATLSGRVPVPSAVLHALPFVATLVAVVGIVGRTRSPRALDGV